MLKCTADLYPRCTQLDVQYSPNSYTNYVVTPVQVFANTNGEQQCTDGCKTKQLVL